MPNVAELIAVTVAVTQFIKKALGTLKVNIEGTGAIILSCVSSLAVVLYFVITTGSPLDFSLIPLVLQVAIGANAGYSLLKVARNPV